MSCLAPLFDPSAQVVFDDFAEKTFFGVRPGYGPRSYDRPWIGMFHHAPEAPDWYLTQHLTQLATNRFWIESIPQLRLLFTLAPNLTEWFEREWGISCATLRHPTEIPEALWSPSAFLASRERRVVQVGWYGRNTHAVFQAPVPAGFSKVWLRQHRVEAEVNHLRLGARLKALYPRRAVQGDVTVLCDLSHAAYDHLLASSVVFVELMFAVANNTVIECIARGTPILINRLSGPEYYLGSEYPLYYRDFREIPDLLTVPRILEAHEYLRALDKHWISGAHFCDAVHQHCATALA
jgi:hypothetical protein